MRIRKSRAEDSLKVSACNRAALAIVACCSTLNCSEGFEGYVLTSEHFEYHLRDGDRVCSELLPTLEDHRAFVDQQLGLGLRDEITRYYKYSDLSDFEQHSSCEGGKIGGCAHAGEVRTFAAFEEHELMHAHSLIRWPGLHAFISEGLAVALSCSAVIDPFGSPLDWRSALVPTVEGQDYWVAGVFVAHLLRRREFRSVFEQFVMRVRKGAGADEFSRAFEDTFGNDIDMFWQEAQAVSTPASPCLPEWACSVPLVETGETFAAECPRNQQYRRLVAQPPNGVRVTVQGSALSSIDCATGSRDAFSLFTHKELGLGETWVEGPLDVALYRSDSSSASVVVEQLPDPWILPSCERNARMVTLQLERSTYLAFGNHFERAYVHLEISQPHDFLLTWRNVPIVADAWICSDCASDIESCHRLDRVEDETISLSGSPVLVIDRLVGAGRLTLGFEP